MNQAQAETAFHNAIRLHHQGKLQEAERGYRDILRYFPALDMVRSNLAAALLDLGDPHEALRQADEAVKLNPFNLDALSNKAACLRALGRVDEAIVTYEQCVKVAPKIPQNHFNLAVAIAYRDGFQAALPHYRKAVQLGPEFVHALLNLGHGLALMGHGDEAAEYFRRVLKVEPGHPGALTNLGNIYSSKGRMEDAMNLYEDALESDGDFLAAMLGRARLLLALGESEDALEELELALKSHAATPELLLLQGNAYMDMNWTKEAADSYRKALALEPDLPGVADQLLRISSERIPLWHFTMLADHARNQAYRDAIEKAVKPGMHVLDIGAGTGLLSMMAARAGAEHVTGVEMGKEMASVAKTVLAQNGYSDRVKVLRMHSGWLKVGEHLPKPVNVIVSEIVDAALLGEGVLPSLRHAWSSLADRNAVMIPCAATVIGMLAELPENSLSNVEGFDLSCLSAYHYPGGMRNIRLKTDNHQALSEPFAITDFDFENIPDEVHDEKPIWWDMEVTASADGVANVVVMWFELHLDEEISVGSGPFDTMDHWGQLAFYLPQPIPVKAGQTIRLNVGRNDKRWWFEG